MGLLCAGLCMLISSSLSFLSVAPVSQGRGMARRTAMRGFKEDFDAWKTTLTQEERELLLRQATNEYNKKYRKSDEFKVDIPEEKIKSFSKVLSKFFESDECIREELDEEAVTGPTPNYNCISEKGALTKFDFSLTPRIVEHNRDADRRYYYSEGMNMIAREQGKAGYPTNTPLRYLTQYQNNDTESHEKNTAIFAFLKGVLEKKGQTENATMKEGFAQMLTELEKHPVPEIGKTWMMPDYWALEEIAGSIEDDVMARIREKALEIDENSSMTDDQKSEEMKQYVNASAWAVLHVATEDLERYENARLEIQSDVEALKEIFRNVQPEAPGRTKADVFKAIWAEAGKTRDLPEPDEELLAELAKEPAYDALQAKNPFGYADKVYKSEAIDPFGKKYLLGVYGTKEAEQAFVEWNKEYEANRETMKEELDQWNKAE